MDGLKLSNETIVVWCLIPILMLIIMMGGI